MNTGKATQHRDTEFTEKTIKQIYNSGSKSNNHITSKVMKVVCDKKFGLSLCPLCLCVSKWVSA